MKGLIFLLLAVSLSTFAQIPPSKPLADQVPYIENQTHAITRMRFKVTQSKHKQFLEEFRPFNAALDAFGYKKYQNLAPYILEKNVIELQQAIKAKILTYTDLTLFYLYRIRLYESDTSKNLNAVISLNSEVLKEAKKLDKLKKRGPLTGIPILLKDNIGFKENATTAGAVIFKDNYSPDAYITTKLKNAGALILGKANLSEWAYYFCQGCPVGYSAVGGQTFNPYARKKVETGGSSSGSGVAGAMNYAALTIGTETSGSILSPSSANALVGLKPTVGYLSRSGIVPISSTLDTPGPMVKNITDCAILLDALAGYDPLDPRSVNTKPVYDELKNLDLKTVTVGIYESLLSRETYQKAVEDLKAFGLKIKIIKENPVQLTDFGKILAVDMRKDLPAYINGYSSLKKKITKVEDIMLFNLKDIPNLAPYGQQNFETIINETETEATFEPKKKQVQETAKNFFFDIFKEADVFLSLANMHAQVAAAANQPCLTLPYGLVNEQPVGITLIGPSWSEKKLLQIGFQLEKRFPKRLFPKNYD